VRFTRLPPNKESPMVRAKKVLIWVLGAFAVYAIITAPTQAADIVHQVWELLMQGFVNLGHFFDALLGNK